MINTSHKLGVITEAEARKLCPKLFTNDTKAESYWGKYEGDSSKVKYKKNDIVVIADRDKDDRDLVIFKILKITSVKVDFGGEDKIRACDDKISWRIGGNGYFRKIV